MKENIRQILIYLIFFILSIYPGLFLGVFIASFSYCLILPEMCIGYEDGYMLYSRIGGVILLNMIFHTFYSKHKKKRDY